jgi:hypothetical protein
MKDKAVISNDLVNDIFYKIPEIHIHHTVCIYPTFHTFDKKIVFVFSGIFNFSFSKIISMG